MEAIDVVILIGASLFVIEGLGKIFIRDFKLLGRPVPCGYSMVILGVGLALKAIIGF